MNVIEMMNKAWEERQKYTHEKNETIFVRLLAKGYQKISKYYSSIQPDYGDTLFILVQDLLIWFIMSDSDFLQGEYDAYVNYCEWADYQPLTTEQCLERYKKLTVDHVVDIVNHISKTRGQIPEEDYQSFVASFCYMSLFGDRDVDKEEYSIISCFFTSDDDYCPNWEKFKKEF